MKIYENKHLGKNMDWFVIFSKVIGSLYSYAVTLVLKQRISILFLSRKARKCINLFFPLVSGTKQTVSTLVDSTVSPTTSTKPTTSASPDVAAYQCDTDRGEDDLTSSPSKSQSTSLNSELTSKHGKADNLLAFYVSMSFSMLAAVTLKSSEEGDTSFFSAEWFSST